MLFFPNAKINIGLNIVEKRPDGYHNLETVFYPISLSDSLEFIVSENKETTFANTGIKIDSPIEKNLCIKAYRLLESKFKLPSLKIHLHKTIPFGAGLGGGSADAAFMLTSLNQHFKLNLNKNELIEYAFKLGSDCAFFIKNKPAYATGRGELLSDIRIDLSGYKILLVKPPFGVGTKEAYAGINPQKPSFDLRESIKKPIEMWKDCIFNDFEPHIFKLYPQIKEIKDLLYQKGAIYASMSGSGSTVYGIFKNLPDDDSIFNDCFVYYAEL